MILGGTMKFSILIVLVKDKYGENADEDSESTSESEDEDAKVCLGYVCIVCDYLRSDTKR